MTTTIPEPFFFLLLKVQGKAPLGGRVARRAAY
jgi:hypothetical protein